MASVVPPRDGSSKGTVRPVHGSDTTLSGLAPLDTMDLSEALLPKDYVVDHIILAGFVDDQNVIYKVRWYGYPPEYDRWESQHHISKNCIRRFWQKQGGTERAFKEGAYDADGACTRAPRLHVSTGKVS